MEQINTAGKVMLDFMRDREQHGKIIAEYIWIDGIMGLRSKCRTINQKVTKLDELPDWNYDGSSTYQASTENSEVILKPCFYFPDPFRGGDNIMVLCETYHWRDTTYTELIPCNTNFRAFAKEIFKEHPETEPWFGIEQEYTMLSQHNRFQTRPYGWPAAGYPGNQGPYYCSVGGNVSFGRTIADAHYKACLYAGINIAGTNAEVMPGQWEFQVGPCLGIEQGDHLWAARYLLVRCAEEYNLSISFDPKLFPDWNGSGCHTNFSTAVMRSGEQGMKYIEDMMVHFEKNHKMHIELYGSDNYKRLTGLHETSSLETFSWAVGNRACSFRVPTQVKSDNGKGYIEDRRPASNIDPYVVSAAIYDTGVVKESKSGPMIEHYKRWAEWYKSAPIETV